MAWNGLTDLEKSKENILIWGDFVGMAQVKTPYIFLGSALRL